MKREIPCNGVVLLTFCALAISSLTFASGNDIVKIQGVLMEVHLKQNSMIVNERLFVWTPNTVFHDEKGSPITVDRLKPNRWVYIIGAKDNVQKRVAAEKVYLLPKFIGEREKHLYPFIQ